MEEMFEPWTSSKAPLPPPISMLGCDRVARRVEERNRTQGAHRLQAATTSTLNRGRGGASEDVVRGSNISSIYRLEWSAAYVGRMLMADGGTAPMPIYCGFENLRAAWAQRQLGMRLGTRSTKAIRRLIVLRGAGLGMSFQGEVGMNKITTLAFLPQGAANRSQDARHYGVLAARRWSDKRK